MKLTNSIALLRPDWVAQYDRKAKEIFLEKEKVIEWILARFPVYIPSYVIAKLIPLYSSYNKEDS